MDYYKIYKDTFSVISRFESLQAAQQQADKMGQGYIAEYYAPYTPPTIQERLDNDISFGQQLIFIFVEDNRVMNITTEQSDELMTKFQSILSFAQVGGITSINAHLPNIPTDEIFTQERKDKYLKLISDYLSQY
jgi:hypothetical protein